MTRSCSRHTRWLKQLVPTLESNKPLITTGFGWCNANSFDFATRLQDSTISNQQGDHVVWYGLTFIFEGCPRMLWTSGDNSAQSRLSMKCRGCFFCNGESSTRRRGPVSGLKWRFLRDYFVLIYHFPYPKWQQLPTKLRTFLSRMIIMPFSDMFVLFRPNREMGASTHYYLLEASLPSHRSKSSWSIKKNERRHNVDN